MDASFDRLVRFVSDDGRTLYGDVPADEDVSAVRGTQVAVLQGDLESGFSRTGGRAIVGERCGADTREKLLAPLPSTPLVICVGLNYRQHATEANLPVARYPVIFTKPADAMTGPFADVGIHPDAQGSLDYEGELTVVIGRDGKNISESDALDYVLGYTAGNDVSARNFQLGDSSGGQFCYAKSFDRFAPVGPCIASRKVVPDPTQLSYVTKVNGEIRQRTPTSDMIWSVQKLITHLSRGTTLRRGTMIMTGTPSGVGLFMKPQNFLKDGDIVEVDIEKIGSIRNKMVFN